MVLGLYLRKGVVYLPTLAKVEAGGHMDVEPVAVVPVSETEDLRRAFRETIARGNPIVPTPTRANYPKPVMPKYAGVKSYAAFERGTLTWDIDERGGIYSIQGWKRAADRGWDPDPGQVTTFPPGTNIGEVIDRMIAILQEAARQ